MPVLTSIISNPLSLFQICEVFFRVFRATKSVALRKTRPLSTDSPLESSFSSISSSDAEDSTYSGIELVVFFVRFVDRLAGLGRCKATRFALVAIVEARKERPMIGARAAGVRGARGDAGNDDESAHIDKNEDASSQASETFRNATKSL